jgi:hypothetical protein
MLQNMHDVNTGPIFEMCMFEIHTFRSLENDGK